MNGAGAVLDCVQIDNSVPALVGEVAEAGRGVEVAVEATFGWYWAVDALTDPGLEVRLAHPRGEGGPRCRAGGPRPTARCATAGPAA